MRLGKVIKRRRVITILSLLLTSRLQRNTEGAIPNLIGAATSGACRQNYHQILPAPVTSECRQQQQKNVFFYSRTGEALSSPASSSRLSLTFHVMRTSSTSSIFSALNFNSRQLKQKQ
jgi:hypothetical protein